ncbi:MAG: gene transfer agent family protein [Parvularculaceae bacterium]|nr:gene transfer agent family protein [Parvularculaceae bacterium]
MSEGRKMTHADQSRPGDADIVINGERHVLRLTLGALASLEETLGEGDFEALQKRLSSPRLADLLIILQALLAGGGVRLSLEALKASDVDLAHAARAVARAFAALGEGAHE